MFSFKAQDTGNLLVPRLIFISWTFLHLSDSTTQNKKKPQPTTFKGRKKRIAEKPQGASIESTTSTAQWQLGERDASKMPCAPEQENDPNEEYKAVN